MQKLPKFLACLALALIAAGCAAPKANRDYTAFKNDRPRSILVLPPLNNSPEVIATYGMLSQMTFPLAEAGYYVLPVAPVFETFKQNGLHQAADMHAVSPTKLRDIFGADAALYVSVTQYGTSYQIISSVTMVAANAKLIDLRTGNLLWSGEAVASDGNNDSSGGLIGMLVSAAIKQIASTLSDTAYPVAGMASLRLLSAGGPNGMLYGPYSPKYGTD